MSTDFSLVQILGNVGNAPELDEDGKKLTFSIAENNSYKDKDGNWQESTRWHRIVVKNKWLIKNGQERIKKGSRVQVFGQLDSRSYEKEGEKKFITEVLLAGGDAKIIFHDPKESNGECA